jgi:hypothetical protein
MVRKFVWACLFSAAALAVGCCACPNNLDYLGPVAGGPTGPAALQYRKNSVLGGDPVLTPSSHESKTEVIEAPDYGAVEPAPKTSVDAEPVANKRR